MKSFLKVSTLFLILLSITLLFKSRFVSASPDSTVVINEIAWSGTTASPNDEWIELYNSTSAEIDLNGWTLAAEDGEPSITLTGTIPAYGFYLLERTDEMTVADVPGDQFYSGTLSNLGEKLILKNSSDITVDTANDDYGPWPAGTDGGGTPAYASMERVDPALPDSDSNWITNDGVIRNGIDALDFLINGTPKNNNSQYVSPTPTPTPTPTPSPSPTATPTPSPTSTPTPTSTPSPTPTSTPEITPTPTFTPTLTPLPTPTLIFSPPSKPHPFWLPWLKFFKPHPPRLPLP